MASAMGQRLHDGKGYLAEQYCINVGSGIASPTGSCMAPNSSPGVVLENLFTVLCETSPALGCQRHG